MKKLYKVEFGSNIAGSKDIVYISSENETNALNEAKPLLNTHKLVPDFLNKKGRYYVTIA